MGVDLGLDLRKAVEPDRVHRSVYTDPGIFEIEMDRIFNKVWTYVGHESQVKKPGDYWTVQIGRQPMVMVRHSDGKVHVLHNRCPHRGAMLYGNRNGNVGDAITCSYHSWQFNTDGTNKAIPLDKGYTDTRLAPNASDCQMRNMKPAARVESYRGFVFASLGGDGPSLTEWLRPAKNALDHICDPAPGGGDQAGADLLSRRPAVELEDLSREPARRAASRGDARIDGARRLRRRGGFQETRQQGAALLSLHVGVLHDAGAQMGPVPDAELSARTLHPDRLHGPQAARSGHPPL